MRKVCNYITILCLVFLSVQLNAQTKEAAPDFSRHEVRFGVGDMLFETMIWHNQVHKSYAGSPAGILYPEKRGYKFLPHISGEYSYHLLPWMSIGGTIDFQQTYWRTEYFNSASDRIMESAKENFYNLCIMPTIRFNYFRREHVGLYSAIAVGLDINGGTEKNGFGQNTVVGAALDIRLIGVRFGANHYWGYVELGGLSALKSKDAMFLLFSEIVRAGFSYGF